MCVMSGKSNGNEDTATREGGRKTDIRAVASSMI